MEFGLSPERRGYQLFMKSLQTNRPVSNQLHHYHLGLLGNDPRSFPEIQDQSIKGWVSRLYFLGDCVEHQDLETTY